MKNTFIDIITIVIITAISVSIIYDIAITEISEPKSIDIENNKAHNSGGVISLGNDWVKDYDQSELDSLIINKKIIIDTIKLRRVRIKYY